MNLTGYDLKTEGALSLSGEWEFFWNSNYEDASRDHFTGGFRAAVPKPWSTFRIGSEALPPYGYATYRLIIERGNNTGNLAIRLREVEDSYRIYVNGKRLGEVGFFAHEYHFARWSFRPATYIIDDPSPRLEIAIEVSNFVYTGGGLTTDISFGTPRQINAMSARNQRAEFFIFGALFIFGIYHLGLFFMRRDDRSALWF
ncbi:MAG TPA: hypothetical protein VF857_00735, partial [Spirochaetota bacterium]